MRFARKVLLLIAVFLAGPAFAATGQPLPMQAWHRKAIGFSIAVYYLSPPASDPQKAARTLAADPRYRLKVAGKLDKTAFDTALLKIDHSANAAHDYAPPSLESLRYFGRGLTLDQAQRLQKAAQVIVLTFAHPGHQASNALYRAELFVAELARQGQAIIWDVETREAFTPESWDTDRLQTWENGIPDVSKQIVIHAYNNDGRTRAITLGMARFGAPDLAINDTVWSLNTPLGNALNAAAQQLTEQGPPEEKGLLQLNIATIRHTAVRKRLSSGVVAGGSGQGRLRLVEASAEAGDPDNLIAALTFDTYPGSSATERQIGFIKSVFGSQSDEVVAVRQRAALREASERARRQLPALQKAFVRGLAPGERLEFKVPFTMTNGGGREYMWVEVLEWKGEQIKGMLLSDPRYVAGLKAGQIVETRQSDVFDYIRRSPDGRTEGNETSKLLK